MRVYAEGFGDRLELAFRQKTFPGDVARQTALDNVAYLRHRLLDANGKPIRGLLYSSAKRPETENLALFIESAEVEGVLTESWKKKDPILRLVSVEEINAGKDAA